METYTKDVDISLLRKRKKRRRQLIKFTAFLMISGLALLLYVNRNKWIPELEGIGSRFQSVKSNGVQLAEGNFPLSISGGIDYQTKELNGSLAILSDAYIYIYNDNGSLHKERQHAYSNAILQTAGKKALIYESGGNKFRVENRNKVLFSKKLDDNIIFARISDEGKIAVITDSETYMCRMVVFDESGNEIYSRNCVERVCDLTFSDNSESCILVTIDAVNGEICSKMISVSFNSKNDNWNSEYIDTMSIKLYMTDDNIFLVGDTKCAYYDKYGEIEYEYTYPSSLKDWDYSDGRAALLFENEVKRHSYVVTMESTDSSPNLMEFKDNNAKFLRIINGYVCILGKNGIMQYDFNGGGEKEISSEGSYEEMIYMNDYIFLLGYDRIDRIDYKS